MACTRKKQCLYRDICPTARSDEYNLIDASCYKPLGQTNEEWLRSATTEELAEFIRKQRDDWSDGWYSDWHKTEEIIEWLKEKHE